MATAQHKNNFPKLHNAAWPGLVGKGPDSEPPIELDTMINLPAAAQVDGVKFDGMDLFLYDPHISIDIDDDRLKKLADKFRAKKLAVGSVVAPVWPPTGGGSAMGSAAERKQFVESVHKACKIAEKLRLWGARPYGVVRIDSACSPGDWAKNADANQKTIAETFRQAADVAEGHGERLAARGEICWGGVHLQGGGVPPRARSAGAGCTPGGGWCSCWRWLPAPRPSASRPTWPTRCSTQWATTPR